MALEAVWKLKMAELLSLGGELREERD